MFCPAWRLKQIKDNIHDFHKIKTNIYSWNAGQLLMKQINLTIFFLFLTRHLKDTLSRGPVKRKVLGNWLPTNTAIAEPLGYLSYCLLNQVFIERHFGDRCDTMSSEEFEKLHEIFKSLYDELQLIPDKALRCHGGKHTRLRDGVKSHHSQ